MGAFFAILCLAIVFRALLWLRSMLDSWATRCYNVSAPDVQATTKVGESDEKVSNASSDAKVTNSTSVSAFQIQVEAPRLLLIFAIAVMGYALMLITMTYVVVRTSSICFDPELTKLRDTSSQCVPGWPSVKSSSAYSVVSVVTKTPEASESIVVRSPSCMV